MNEVMGWYIFLFGDLGYSFPTTEVMGCCFFCMWEGLGILFPTTEVVGWYILLFGDVGSSFPMTEVVGCWFFLHV